MREPTLASVKSQIEQYRSSRRSRRQPIPKEIVENLRHLAKSIPIKKLRKELNLSQSMISKIHVPKPEAEVLRLAPISLLAAAEPLVVELLLRNGAQLSVRGLSGPSDAAVFIRVLGEG